MTANVFFPYFLLKILFIHQSETNYDWTICSFTISLSYPRTHPLFSLSPFFYICSWLSNKPPHEIITNPISLLLSYVPISKKITALFTFKVNNKNTRTRCEICSKLAKKIPERRKWPGKLIRPFYLYCSNIKVVEKSN